MSAPSGAMRPADLTAIHRQEPGPVTLTLRIPGDRRQFRPGEMIPIELEFNSPVPKRFVVDGATYDRSGRLTIDEFVIEPNDAVVDPLLDYFASIGGYIGGGLRPTHVLGEEPATVRLELNDRFRFDTPGSYRLTIRSRRVSDDLQPREGNSAPIVPVESNTAVFEILPRDAAWEAAELAAAVRILGSGAPEVERRRGCQMLRFLGTDAAVDQMIRRYGDGQWGCEFDYTAGLFGAPNRQHAVRQMEARLVAADQPVTGAYVTTLAALSVYVREPGYRAPQTRATKGRVRGTGTHPERQGAIAKATARYLDVTFASVEQKSGSARAVTLRTLSELQHLR